MRRVALLLPNTDGVYDHLAIYKSKKDSEPLVTLYNHEFVQDVVDEAIKNDTHYRVNAICVFWISRRTAVKFGVDYHRHEYTG